MWRLEPERSENYWVAQAWREWSERLDRPESPLVIALPEERPLAAGHQQADAQDVIAGVRAEEAAELAGDFLQRFNDETQGASCAAENCRRRAASWERVCLAREDVSVDAGRKADGGGGRGVAWRIKAGAEAPACAVDMAGVADQAVDEHELITVQLSGGTFCSGMGCGS